MKYWAKKIVPRVIWLFARESYHWLKSKSDANAIWRNANDSSKCKFAFSYNKYGAYCVPLSCRRQPDVRKILRKNVYEPDTIAFLITNAGDGDIIHAGAFFGDFLPALANACGKKNRVWAFEPNPESYTCAKITTLINGLDNVVLEQAALGKNNSNIFLSTTDQKGNTLGGSSAIVKREQSTHSDAYPIRLLAIDDFIPLDRKITVIQLDVEGYEKEALSGSLATIFKWRPILVIEVWSRSALIDSDWFRENILDMGYEEKGSVHNNFIFRMKSDRV